MDTSNLEIEEKLKKRLAHVAPPRSLFVATMDAVTKESPQRYSKYEGNVLSPYQVYTDFFMKKVLLIGTPMVALALVLVVSSKSNLWSATTPVPLQDSSQTTEAAPSEVTTGNTGALTTNEVNTVTTNDSTTIDAVFAEIIAGVSSDTATLAAEEDDATTINTELENYNNAKNSNYEDII